MIGKKLAHYEILETLGSGGMGDVYRARDSKLNRDVALKVLPAEFNRDPARRSRFVREAQSIAALKHPNIVTIYSVEEAEGVDFIAMELVEGNTLAKRIQRGGVTLEEFFDYGIPLADAISSAHEHGITHRDLKPTNIMFDRDGRLKVLDFGLAKLLSVPKGAGDAETIAESGDTDIGQIIGTTAYMSPEQAEGKPIDHRSDIFSLGIVLYEIATGERPFRGDTQISTISSILKDTPRHISEVRREMPRHVGRIVNRCLEKSPDRRFQSAKDVRNDLEGLKREIDSGELSAEMESAISMASGVGAAPVAQTGSDRKLPMPMLIGGAVVVAAALLFTFWPRGSRTGLEATSVKSGATARAGDGAITAVAQDDRSMAVVLPFDNLGSDDDAYFAAGMTDELTSRLSAVNGIGIISRTSARQYDRTGKTMREIGEDLGVDYVVEGSVRFAKTGDGAGRVRITPLLIRVSDDTQIWSEAYDRDIDDVFQVQSEIASKVVEALGVTLGTAEQEIVESVPTENMEAYEAYVRAVNAEDRPSDDPFELDRRIVELLEKATRLDPNFLEAWALLSRHQSAVYFGPMDRTEARLDAARNALRRAEALDPDAFATHMARGSYYYYGFRDYDRALTEYETAIRLVPNDAEAWAAVGYIYRRQGRWSEHVETLKRSLELDPQNANTARNLANSYVALREPELALRYANQALAVSPDNIEGMFSKLDALTAMRVSYDEIEAFFESLKPSMPRSFAQAFAGLQYGRYDQARDAVDEIPALPEEAPEFNAWKYMLKALIEYLESDGKPTKETLSMAEKFARQALENAPTNAEMHGALAMNLAMQRHDDEAISEARMAADLVAKDAFSGPAGLKNLAQVYMIIGRTDEAIDILLRLHNTPYENPVTENDLRFDPFWKKLHDNPRYKELVPPTS